MARRTPSTKKLDAAHAERLRATLDALIQVSDLGAHRRRDPVELVWSYEHKLDREIAALCASGLAYGRVALVRDAGRRAMAPLGDQPARAR